MDITRVRQKSIWMFFKLHRSFTGRNKRTKKTERKQGLAGGGNTLMNRRRNSGSPQALCWIKSLKVNRICLWNSSRWIEEQSRSFQVWFGKTGFYLHFSLNNKKCLVYIMRTQIKAEEGEDGANNMERLFSSKLLSTLALQAYNGLVLLVCEELLLQCFLLLLLLLPIILLSKLKTQQWAACCWFLLKGSPEWLSSIICTSYA